jgi:hypothetical protein
MKLEPRNEYKCQTKLKSPYDIDTSKHNVIDVFINSNGGDVTILNSISTLLGIAKSKGAIIRTTVCGKAYSCGSALAITGTPGFRIMYANAYHLVHFGTQTRTAKQESEIESVTNSMKEHHTNWNKQRNKTNYRKLSTNESEFNSVNLGLHSDMLFFCLIGIFCKSFLMIIIHKVNATFGAFCLNINHSELITAFRTISHKIFLPILILIYQRL